MLRDSQRTARLPSRWSTHGGVTSTDVEEKALKEDVRCRERGDIAPSDGLRNLNQNQSMAKAKGINSYNSSAREEYGKKTHFGIYIVLACVVESTSIVPTKTRVRPISKHQRK